MNKRASFETQLLGFSVIMLVLVLMGLTCRPWAAPRSFIFCSLFFRPFFERFFTVFRPFSDRFRPFFEGGERGREGGGGKIAEFCSTYSCIIFWELLSFGKIWRNFVTCFFLSFFSAVMSSCHRACTRETLFYSHSLVYVMCRAMPRRKRQAPLLLSLVEWGSGAYS